MALDQGRIEPGFLADDEANGTMVLLPPQNGGALGWGQVYLSLGCDFGDMVLRVAVYNDALGDYRVNDDFKIPRRGPRVMVPIQDGDEKVSIGRVKAGPADTGRFPCAWMIETALHP